MKHLQSIDVKPGLQILFVLGVTGIAVSSLAVTGSRRVVSRSLFLSATVLTGRVEFTNKAKLFVQTALIGAKSLTGS